MKSKIYYPILCLFFLVACQNKPEAPETNQEQNTQEFNATSNTPDMHNSKTALDWQGVYRGILPCADCPGIKTEIILNSDNTFEKWTLYIDRDNQKNSSMQTGTFTWSADGNKITLDEDEFEQYQVGENQLFKLDNEGNRITGDIAENYLLKRPEPATLRGTYWRLFELNGKPYTTDSGKVEIYLELADTINRVSGSAGCNRIMGSFVSENELELKFEKVATTLMACPDMETESQFLKMLESVDNYSLKNDTLSLNKARIAPLARFKAEFLRE
ncbi:MAG: copper resistance protein NlpE N-terminal domain-containing protein [Flavobacteriaceae bacterium]|nr:copper resistance protein NlpE N-terminal domain-containing protein [Flavobacteriaceae bacterium]